jgi:hypothetical protein
MYEDTDGNPFNFQTDPDPNDESIYRENTLDFFEKAEPRLKGSIVLPGDVLKGEVIGVRKGIVPEGNAITDFLATGSFDETYNGMTIQGTSGMGYNETTVTGFYLRKWIDPTLAKADVAESKSTTPWIEMRYAEMLLTRAEAAVELNDLGDASKMNDAVACMQLIRDRAGAFKKYTTPAELTIDAVRWERRRELFYENKTHWDLKRWRIFDKEFFNREWNVLYPIFVWDKQKYYMKKASLTVSRITFNPTYYYLQIPTAEISTNPLLEQNPGY